MVMYKGGTLAGSGSYWNPLDGQGVNMREHGMLPGDAGRSYLKISPAFLLVIAPLFGMTYVIFLPLFGVAALLIFCLVRTIDILASAAVTGVRVCGSIAVGRALFTSNPSRAYLASIRKKGKRSVNPTTD